jgi:hypothetical protein
LEYPQQVFQPSEPIKYLPIDKTKAIWVDTYEGVLEMLEELKKATEIAIDLEHHDFRTYTGLLSLMQISTREKDWIVDTLVPWRHKLEILNEVFADPKILKVSLTAGFTASCVADKVRFFMAHSWISSGSNETSDCMSSGSLILTMLVMPSDTQAEAWHFF